jgi:hypothetical protein
VESTDFGFEEGFVNKYMHLMRVCKGLEEIGKREGKDFDVRKNMRGMMQERARNRVDDVNDDVSIANG